jgi:hypothetical protein
MKTIYVLLASIILVSCGIVEDQRFVGKWANGKNLMGIANDLEIISNGNNTFIVKQTIKMTVGNESASNTLPSVAAKLENGTLNIPSHLTQCLIDKSNGRLICGATLGEFVRQ